MNKYIQLLKSVFIFVNLALQWSHSELPTYFTLPMQNHLVLWDTNFWTTIDQYENSEGQLSQILRRRQWNFRRSFPLCPIFTIEKNCCLYLFCRLFFRSFCEDGTKNDKIAFEILPPLPRSNDYTYLISLS